MFPLTIYSREPTGKPMIRQGNKDIKNENNDALFEKRLMLLKKMKIVVDCFTSKVFYFSHTMKNLLHVSYFKVSFMHTSSRLFFF